MDILKFLSNFFSLLYNIFIVPFIQLWNFYINGINFTFIEGNIVVVSILSFFVSLIVLVVAFFIPRRMLVNQLFSELIKEFRTEKFSKSLEVLWDFYQLIFEEKVFSLRTVSIESQIILRNFDRSHRKQEIDDARRIVALFYQNMGYLKYYGILFSRLTYRRIKKFFDIYQFALISVLIPLQLVAKPLEDENEIPKRVNVNKVYLLKLYKRTCGWYRRHDKWLGRLSNLGSYYNKRRIKRKFKFDIDEQYYNFKNN